MSLNSILQRYNNPKQSEVELCQKEAFIEILCKMKIKNGKALSVGVGDGMWDWMVLRMEGIKKIIAIDIVNNPVKETDQNLIKDFGDWEFIKVEPDSPLPFKSESFDLIYHQDVIEHTRKPYLFLSEQYRVLKNGGRIIIGTPNLFRPGNLFKILTGRLKFPVKIGFHKEIGDYIHVQEFYEQQINLLLKEKGFKNIEVLNLFFGIHPLNIGFSKRPKTPLGKLMCQFLLFSAVK